VAERRLSHDFAHKLRAWHPSGFGVYRSCPSFAASRLQYDPEEGRIESRTSKGRRRSFSSRPLGSILPGCLSKEVIPMSGRSEWCVRAVK